MQIQTQSEGEPTPIECTVSQINGDFAILKPRDESLPEYRWPLAQLPENIQSGDTLLLTAKTPAMQKDTEYEHMRHLLAELIN